MRCANASPWGPPWRMSATTRSTSCGPESAIRCRKWLYSPRSTSGSSCRTAAWACVGIVANRIRNGSADLESAPSTRMPAAARRCPASAGASGRGWPSRTKSALGSSTTMRRSVPSRSCSRMTPRAYVLPDPLWPHRNVCREKPWARNLAATSTSAERQVPTGSAAPRACCSDSRSPVEAASTGAAAKGCRGTGPSPPSGRSSPTRRPPQDPVDPRVDGGSSTWPSSVPPSAVASTTRSPTISAVSAWSKVKVRPSREVANSGLDSALCVTRAAGAAAAPGSPAPP